MDLFRINRLLMFAVFGIYCFIYPSSLFLLMTDSVPAGTEWMAFLMLMLEGLSAAAWVTLNYGLRRGLATSLAVLLGGFGVEVLGVKTGFPFGKYEYTDLLAPRILGVPIGITFAWFMIVLSAYFTARYIVYRLWPQRGYGTVILLCGLLTVLADLLIEPVAVNVQGYWLWQDRGPYYAVPTSNFIAWGGIALLMALVITILTGERNPATSRNKLLKFGFIPLALNLMNMFMFFSINLSHSNFLAGSIGLIVLSGCGLLLVLASQSLPFSRPANLRRAVQKVIQPAIPASREE